MNAKNVGIAVEPLLPVELGAGKVKFAQGMKAGRWVFATHQTEPGFFRQDSGEKELEFIAGVGLSRAITELRDARRA